MSGQERDRPGLPETRVLKINLACEEAVRRMFPHGLPRKKRKGTSSASNEPVQASDWGHGRTAGADGHGPR